MVNQGEFTRRRRQLMRMTGAGSITILCAAATRLRNGDSHYYYRQDSDFYYLSGFSEPEAVLVLVPGRKSGETILFCREKDQLLETWEGAVSGLEGACADYAMDDAFPISDIDDILPGLIEGCDRVFYSIGRDTDFDQQLMGWVHQVRTHVQRTGGHVPDEFVSLEHILHDMRLYKTKGEIASMRKAAQIATKAHLAAMQRLRPGVQEYQIQAELLYQMYDNQAVPSYSPIVAGGKNACAMHYLDNNQPLVDGDLLLIDAGAEFDHYASDITRTLPVNGRFTGEQRALYEIVLASQEAAIKVTRPGVCWDTPHQAALEVVCEGLTSIGIVRGSANDCLASGAYKPFFGHRTGHWLGMDVHDVGDYKVDGQWRILEKGMAMTVEPGIYIHPAMKGVDERWKGIGIRIEDDVVVSKDGVRVLSDKLPKSIADIEHLTAQ